MKETAPETPGKKKKQDRKKTFRSKRDAFDWMGREAAVTLSIAAFFFLWWVLALYREAGPKKYILGMPEWFFYGAFVGTILFVIAVWIVVGGFFRETEPNTRTAAKKKKRAAAKAKLDAEKTMEGPEGPIDWQTAAAEALALKKANLTLEALDRETEDAK